MLQLPPLSRFQLVDRIDNDHLDSKVIDPGLDESRGHLLPAPLLREQDHFTWPFIEVLQEPLVCFYIEAVSLHQRPVPEALFQTKIILHFLLGREKRSYSGPVLMFVHLRAENSNPASLPKR